MRCAASSTVSSSSLIAGSSIRIGLLASCRMGVVGWVVSCLCLFGGVVLGAPLETFGDEAAQYEPVGLAVGGVVDVDGFPGVAGCPVVACLVGRPAIGVGCVDARFGESGADHFRTVGLVFGEGLVRPVTRDQDPPATVAEVLEPVCGSGAVAGLHPRLGVLGLDAEPEPVRALGAAGQPPDLTMQPSQVATLP